MYDNGFEHIHIEISSGCNAACPLCNRTENPIINKSQTNISLDQFKTLFSEKDIKRIKHWNFCGNYGDPAFNKECLEIHQYILDVNPFCVLEFSTNAGLRSTEFWKELGGLYKINPYSRVDFHIDGLEDTNHLYRKNVSWKKLIKNAESYISTGARANWVFIPFKHNEHQIEEAKQMSKDLGFDNFILKLSARNIKNSKDKSIKDPENYDTNKYLKPNNKLICLSEQRKSIYVDSWGNLFPCCWTGTEFIQQNNPWNLDPEKINLYKTTIDQVINNKQIMDLYRYLQVQENSICDKKCGKNYKRNHFLDSSF